MSESKSRGAIALVAMPWQPWTMPSLQLAVLRAWVNARVPEIAVDEYHHYLEALGALGIKGYDAVVHQTDVHESTVSFPEGLYAALLFEDERERITKAIEGVCPRLPVRETLEKLDVAARACAARIATTRYGIVGFSVSFYQTFSSLYLAKLVRELDPEALIVFGGPEVPGRVGASFVTTFPFVDFVANGEGEGLLEEMARILRDRPRDEWSAAIAALPRVLSKASDGASGDASMPQAKKIGEIRNLDELPWPAFEAYFDQRPEEARSHQAILPIESSRGCWWDRSNLDPHKSCTFCNLNASWSGYREKSSTRAVEEIMGLARRYEMPEIILVDNVLRQGPGLQTFLDGLRQHPDRPLFRVDSRASLKPNQLVDLRRAGAREIQLGIESLSTSVLRRLINKGTTAMANMAAMRWVDELGIEHDGGIISHYPGVTAEEVRECIANVDFVCGLRPLRLGSFALGYFSPAFRLAEEFGLKNIRNRPDWDACLPEELRSKIYTLYRDFDSDVPPEVADLWGRLAFRMIVWRVHYQAVREKLGVRSLLLMRPLEDGGLLIRDLRREPFTELRLGRAEADIYLAALYPANEADLAARFTTVDVSAFVDRMVARHLMFRERTKVVSLAIAEEEGVPPFYMDKLQPLEPATRSSAAGRPRTHLQLAL